MKARLMLEDGFTMTGETFSGRGEVFGEVVFSTGMTGYQEMLTDPSYQKQILNFTYPLIGNYGCNREDVESARPRVEAVLVKQYCSRPHNSSSEESLGDYLNRYGVIGVEGIDTRTLTLHLRRSGTMSGVISTETTDPAELRDKLRPFPGIAGMDLVKEVTTPVMYSWDQPLLTPFRKIPHEGNGGHVVVVDFGVKYSILRALAARGFRVTVVPATTPAADIKALNPGGILLSNGPGDPMALEHLLPTIRALIGWRPLMGICLGHQLLGRALNMQTFKLTFGHRGSNHPVKDTRTGQVLITTQNHGFCLHANGSLPEGTAVTHLNLNDGTLEGIENKSLGFFSVQFHPEAGPGPHDYVNLFDEFSEMVAG